MTSPTLSDQLQTALDELDMAHNTMIIALDDAMIIGLVPFRLASIRSAISKTMHATHELLTVINALKLAYPNSPL